METAVGRTHGLEGAEGGFNVNQLIEDEKTKGVIVS